MSVRWSDKGDPAWVGSRIGGVLHGWGPACGAHVNGMVAVPQMTEDAVNLRTWGPDGNAMEHTHPLQDRSRKTHLWRLAAGEHGAKDADLGHHPHTRCAHNLSIVIDTRAEHMKVRLQLPYWAELSS